MSEKMSERIIDVVYSDNSEAVRAIIGRRHILRILRGFVESGREKILKESLVSCYYDPEVSMTEDGQFEELRSYAKRLIGNIPDWMSFDEFFDEFEPELKERYEKSISERKEFNDRYEKAIANEKQCENS